MTKKRYFILTPGCSPERKEELIKKASLYYGEKDYEPTSGNSDLGELFKNVLNELANADCNADLILIGMTALAMAKSDSIYVAKDWEKEDICKVAHMLAFTHGLDIVYEPV